MPIESPQVHFSDLEDSCQSDSLMQSETNNCHLQTFSSKEEDFICKVTELVESNSETGVTLEVIESQLKTAEEDEDFKSSVHRYVEAALQRGRIRKVFKEDKEIFYPANDESILSSTRLKENCKEKSSEQKTEEKLKKLDTEYKSKGIHLTQSINTILSEATSILDTDEPSLNSLNLVDDKSEREDSEKFHKTDEIVNSNDPPHSLPQTTNLQADEGEGDSTIDPTDEKQSTLTDVNEITDHEPEENKVLSELKDSLSSIKKPANKSLSLEEISKGRDKDKESDSIIDPHGNSCTIMPNKKKIPIYRSSIPKIKNKEFFSDKFVNKNKLHGTKKGTFAQTASSHSTTERKVVERRKFGSLNTKFQGKKSFASGTKMDENDPFSLEIDEQEEVQTAINKEVLVQNDPIGASVQGKSSKKESRKRGRPKLKANDSLIKSKVRKSSLANPSTSTELAENKEEKFKKHKRKKKKTVKPPAPNPTCPHCFKFLLNPVKMRSHLAECGAAADLPEHHIKLTIRLSSDKEKVEIKESN